MRKARRQRQTHTQHTTVVCVRVAMLHPTLDLWMCFPAPYKPGVSALTEGWLYDIVMATINGEGITLTISLATPLILRTQN
jgi:hypothetical protein